MLKNVRGMTKEDPLIDVTPRTVQRWVSGAADALSDQTDNTDWNYVTAHDCRRTWASTTYYSLSAPYSLEVIMQWGGWTDGDTFRSNYLGKEPNHLAVEMMDEAGLR